MLKNLTVLTLGGESVIAIVFSPLQQTQVPSGSGGESVIAIAFLSMAVFTQKDELFVSDELFDWPR